MSDRADALRAQIADWVAQYHTAESFRDWGRDCWWAPGKWAT